ncbi:O-antigen ligase family protein [Aeromicrobium ginsengisoli]|uniref:O-antigen ligase family protein n=1 Tax=Aeromicrobium ginsengisoli TaxID=363867 RepID=A0A5M4FBQ5_9ACTN|nr:O-antigen ligase family protein [Aeromicrobium ginsengisoli]KAA1395814.1 O-antigen ligase family protein [Aeromicrobium ginsengisoli]
MSTLQFRTSSTAGWSVVAGGLGVLGVTAFLDTSLRHLVLLGLFGAVVLFVVAAHPRSVFRLTGFVLAGAPLLPAPGLGAPLILVLGMGVWVAVALIEGPPLRIGWVEVLAALSVGASGVAMIMTSADSVSIVEYGRWVIAFSLVIPLRMLSAADLASFGRWFVLGSCFGAGFGLVLAVVDRTGRLLDRLSAVGYDPDGNNARVVRGSQTVALRLTGTYVDPNLGAFILVVGLILAVALLRGLSRVAAAGLISAAIALTLSRTSIATVVAAILILIVVANISGRARLALLVATVLSAAGALASPVVRYRLADSFGPTDTGTQARLEAFHHYVNAMQGHWWFGKGWGIPEFRDSSAALLANYVANAPLLTVYRAGVFVGVIFVLLLIAGLFRSYVLVQRGTFAQAVVAAGFAAVALVALQLDFPVVLLPPATMSFAVLLAFLSHDRWTGVTGGDPS